MQDDNKIHFFDGLLLDDNRRKMLVFVLLNEIVLLLIIDIFNLDRYALWIGGSVAIVMPAVTWTLLLAARWITLKVRP
jgi:membrane protein implicated in regulation of membrane protease activity